MKKINGWLLLAALMSLPLQAKKEDMKEPIHVDAATTEGSIKDQKLLYSGDVRVQQGSLLIKADQLIVDRSAGKGKEVFIARGKPATYSQVLDGEKPIQARAEEIRYSVGNRILNLNGKAEITQSGSQVRSSVIEYDLIGQKLTANSGKENERVSTVFSPEEE